MLKKLFILGTVLVLGSFPLYAGKFGNPEDVEFARTVWQAMTKASLVGDNAFVSQNRIKDSLRTELCWTPLKVSSLWQISKVS